MPKNNRYTRLKNIKEFGFDVDFDELKQKAALIIGVGGVGSLVAEILTRCGIGKLFIIDLDVVEEVNLNRLFFSEEHIGRSKVEVVGELLKKINPSVTVESFHSDVCAVAFQSTFDRLIDECDIALSCLDNFPTRTYINERCVSLNKEYIDTGASRSGLGGYVHLVIPHKTACYECIGSIDLGLKEEGEPCTASLPSTIAIIASLAAEHTLKYLLKFGNIPDYIGFNAITDHFSHKKHRRDPGCYICGEQEKEKDLTDNAVSESLQYVETVTGGQEIDQLLEALESQEKKD